MADKILPKNNQAAFAQVYKRNDHELNVSVSVRDADLKRDGHQYDGYEKAFALVPQTNANGQVEWKRHDLGYQGRGGDRSGSVTDFHGATLHSCDLNLDDIRRHGIAFGLETNNGTVWLQNRDDNYKPSNF